MKKSRTSVRSGFAISWGRPSYHRMEARPPTVRSKPLRPIQTTSKGTDRLADLKAPKDSFHITLMPASGSSSETCGKGNP